MSVERDHRGRVINPTLVIGLDATGQAIARATRREGEARTTEEVHALVRFIDATSDDAGLGALEAAVTVALDALLAIGKVAEVRADQGLWSAPIDVFLLGRLGDGHTPPPALSRALAAIDPAVRAHAARLVTPDGSPRLYVSPLLLLPRMPAASVTDDWSPEPEQEAVIEALAALEPRLDAPGSGARLGRVYLVEPGTRTYLLDDDTREEMVRAFLSFLLYGSLRRDTDQYQQAYQPTGDRDPFGSFVVARAELPGDVYRPYLRARTALVGLEAFRSPRDEALAAELAADEETVAWVEALVHDAQGRSDPSLDRLVADQLARIAAPPAPMRFLEGPRAFARRMGETWLDDNLAAAEEIALRAAEDDGRVAELLTKVDLDGAQGVRGAARAMAQRLDDQCLGRDAPGHHMDGLRLIDAVTGEIEQRRHDLAATANAPIPKLDGATALAATHADLVRAVEAKPHPTRFLLLGLGALFLLWYLSAALLPLLGGLFDKPWESGRPAWLRLLVEEPAYLIVAALLVFGVGLMWMRGKLVRTTRAVNRYLDGESLLTSAVERLKDSLGGQFTRRRDAALTHGASRLLTRYLRQLERERRTLARADDALNAQIETLRRRLRALGVQGAPEASPPALRDTILARPLVSPAGMVALGGRVRDRVLGQSPVRAVKQALDPYRRRHDALPFADLSPLEAAVDARSEDTNVASVLADAELGDQAAGRLVAFFRETLSLAELGGGRAAGTRLQLPLDTSGVELDAEGPGGLAAPRLLAHGEVLSALAARAEVASDPRMRHIVEVGKPFHDPDRVYLMQAVWGLSPQTIGWLGAAWGRRDADVIPLAKGPKTPAGGKP